MKEKIAIEQPGLIIDTVRVNGQYIVEHRNYKNRRQAAASCNRRYDLRQYCDRRRYSHIEIYV